MNAQDTLLLMSYDEWDLSQPEADAIKAAIAEIDALRAQLAAMTSQRDTFIQQMAVLQAERDALKSENKMRTEFMYGYQQERDRARAEVTELKLDIASIKANLEGQPSAMEFVELRAEVERLKGIDREKLIIIGSLTEALEFYATRRDNGETAREVLEVKNEKSN